MRGFLKQKPTILEVILTGLCLVLTASIAVGADHEQLPSIDWKHLYKEEAYSFNHKVVFLHEGNETIYLAGTYVASGKMESRGEIEGIWIWEIDSEGEKLSSFLIKNSEEAQTNFQNIVALSVSKSKDISIVVQSREKETSLLRMDQKGNRVWTKKLGRGKHVSKIFSLGDGAVLLIGHELLNPMILEIDNSGSVLRSKVFDRGRSDFFVDGLPGKSGGFVFLENSGELTQFYMGPSNVWISVYDSKMEKLAEQQFAGRNGNIIANDGHGYIVVYDRSHTAKQEIHLKSFGESLEEKWNIKVVETPFGLGKFRVVRLLNGRALVGGAINGHRWIGEVSANGKSLKKFNGQEGTVELGIDLKVFGKNLYIISTVVHLTDQHAVNNQIKIVKLKTP